MGDIFDLVISEKIEYFRLHIIVLFVRLKLWQKQKGERLFISELLNFLMIFLLIFLVTLPVATLIHELGHALVLILCSKTVAYVYVGERSKRNKEKFRIGRIRFHLRWPAGSGFCDWDRRINLSRKRLLWFFAVAPLASLCVSIGYFVAGMLITDSFWRVAFFNSSIAVFVFHFLGSAIPMKYPRDENYSDGWWFLYIWNGGKL